MVRLSLAVLVAWLGVVSCSPPVNIAGEPLAAPTTGEAFGGVQCSAVRPQTEPDLMAWDSGSRANLNRLRGVGVVAVRYQAKGCNVELELLSNCIGVGSKYAFSPYSANERKVAHNASELFAQLPIGAAALGGSVKGGRALRTDYMLAGQYALPPDARFSSAELRGLDCERATHVISAIYVGAFVMGAGESRELDANATLFGAGAHGTSQATVDVLNTEGDPEACAVAQKEGKESFGCAVPLRIGLSPLSTAPASEPPALPTAETLPVLVGPVPTGEGGAPSTTTTPAVVPSAPANGGRMLRIAGADFWMGTRAPEGASDEYPRHRVTVAPFELDVTEVTVAAYAACVQAGKCTVPASSAPGCNYAQPDKGNHPINCLDWSQAVSFCAAYGKRLPSEEEWEYAARGGSDGRAYSWGEATPDAQLCWSGKATRLSTCAVGSYARGAYSLADLAGNVWEWTASGYSDDYSRTRTAMERVIRGGGFGDNRAGDVRGAARGRHPASGTRPDLGFRCAR